MTLEAQAEALAKEAKRRSYYCGQYAKAIALDPTLPGTWMCRNSGRAIEFWCDGCVIGAQFAALQRVQAETREEDAKLVEESGPGKPTFYGPMFDSGWETGVRAAAKLLRARAAQSQEPTTAPYRLMVQEANSARDMTDDEKARLDQFVEISHPDALRDGVRIFDRRCERCGHARIKHRPAGERRVRSTYCFDCPDPGTADVVGDSGIVVPHSTLPNWPWHDFVEPGVE